MRQQPLLYIALATGIASFICHGNAVAQGQDDTSNKNAGFYQVQKARENTSAIQTLKQVTAALSVAARNGSTDDIAHWLSQEAFEHSRQGGGASNDGAVAVPAVVVSTAIAAAVPPEQIRLAAPKIPESQRQAVGTLLKYVPDLKKDSPSIDNIFVPSPGQQAKDTARVQQVHQSAAPANAQIQQKVQQQGSPGICILDRTSQ